jgi:FAD/FMN-containing dehydrogenase
VVDLGNLTTFSYDSVSKTAIVGAGFRLGPLKLALWNAGKVTIPSGTCPSVGVGGHVSRKFGIMADSILEAQVVISNGSVVTASSSQNSDLFRALKGAGANSFGKCLTI